MGEWRSKGWGVGSEGSEGHKGVVVVWRRVGVVCVGRVGQKAVCFLVKGGMRQRG